MKAKIPRFLLWRLIGLNEYLGSIIMKNCVHSKHITHNDLKIRVAQSIEDVNESIRIHEQVFGFPLDKERYTNLYNLFSKVFFIAEKNNRVVGYCFFKVTPLISSNGVTKKARLLSVGVTPNEEQAIGKFLLETSLKELKKYNIPVIYLDVDHFIGVLDL